MTQEEIAIKLQNHEDQIKSLNDRMDEAEEKIAKDNNKGV